MTDVSLEGMSGALEYAALALSLTDHADLGLISAAIVEEAVKRLGVDVVLLWALPATRPAQMYVRASTGQPWITSISELSRDTAQDAVPAATALAELRPLMIENVAHADRWPLWRNAVNRQLPNMGAAVYPLRVHNRDQGVLEFYAAREVLLDPHHAACSAVFAAHAAIAVDNVALADQAHHLQQALTSNRRIGIAIGVLVALYKMSEDQAFQVMRSASQHNHVKLGAIAEDVIRTGALPYDPIRSRS